MPELLGRLQYDRENAAGFQGIRAAAGAEGYTDAVNGGAREEDAGRRALLQEKTLERVSLNRREALRAAAMAALPPLLVFGNGAAKEPWSSIHLLEPAELAGDIQKQKEPLLLSVGFPVLYRQKHIAHAKLAGPASKPEGIARLKEALATTAKNAPIVIYCGCCPMVDCPNLRPAFLQLGEMGYGNVRVLNLPTNFRTDWVEKGYPVESSLPVK
ncbi:MAG TPA: hypothetical protein VH477_04390 [Bryobacteraceae bacterium]